MENNISKILNVRPLKAEEIEVRVGSKTKTDNKMLLLYKNARVDMALLDETVGAMNWQRFHEMIGGNLFCKISIYDNEKKEWISKEDVGVESYSEKEKGQASDSFKRAGFNWGIGRELYTAPTIFVDGRFDYFKVTRIGYDDNRVINDLQIIETNGNTVVYEMQEGKKIRISNPLPRNNYNQAPAKTSANIQRSNSVANGSNCSGCGVAVDDKVEWYSNEYYGKVLCRTCQGNNQRIK